MADSAQTSSAHRSRIVANASGPAPPPSRESLYSGHSGPARCTPGAEPPAKLTVPFLAQVHIKSSFIMNGVCVRYRGWIDLDRLDGVGCLEYDEERGRLEDAVLRDQIECYNQRLRDFEEKQRAFRARHERQAEAELEVRRKHQELSPDRGGSASN
ncbi:hypothetical protein V5799_019509 [Amblyomma americanum]|uniref:Uncharacterized protein n=1 Tax=Amblyomma americanum TaxID=6943 RepID=A0AAQ4EWN9_AMBAM